MAYEYDGKEFSSIKKLAEYAGINEKTLTARLKRGMKVDEACTRKLLNKRYYEIGGEEKGLSQICSESQKDAALVRNRLKYGYSLEKALNTPKKVRRQGYPIVVNGILYNSIAQAIRKYGKEKEEHVIR